MGGQGNKEVKQKNSSRGMQILGLLGVLLIGAGVAAAVIFMTGKDKDEVASNNATEEN
jgi:hypothetical protein